MVPEVVADVFIPTLPSLGILGRYGEPKVAAGKRWVVIARAGWRHPSWLRY